LGRQVIVGLIVVVLAAASFWWAYERTHTRVIGPASSPVATARRAPSQGASAPSEASNPQFPRTSSTLDDSDPNTFIALRYDKTHVLFRLGEKGDFTLRTAEDEQLLHPVPEAIAKYGVAPAFDLDPRLDDQTRAAYSAAHVREQWELELQAGSRVPVTVQKPVTMPWNCGPQSYTAAYIAEVAPEFQAAFATLKQDYFLVHKITAASPTQPQAAPQATSTQIAMLPDWQPTPETREQIERAVTAAVKDVIAKERAKPWIYEGRTDLDKQVRARHEGWRQFQDRTAAGEGHLDYDMHALRLSPDGEPRLFVRARWMVDDSRTLLMSLWLHAGTSVTVIDETPGFWQTSAWIEKGGGELGDTSLDSRGEVLNIFDRPDGYGDVLMYFPGYEGYDIHLFRYTDKGVVATEISHGDGC
jgi:hypothetical protein